MPAPVLLHRPARAADAELQYIVFEEVDRLARLRKKARLERTEHGVVAPAAQHLEGGANELCERMMHTGALVVAKIRDAAVLKRQREHVAVGSFIARQNGDVAPAQSLLAAKTHDVGGGCLHLKPPRRRFDEAEPPLALLCGKREGKRMALDGGKRCRLKALIFCHGMHAHGKMQLVCQSPELLQGLRLPVEETALALRPRLARRIEGQRDVHRLCLLKERRQDAPFLRMKEGKAVDPDLCAVQKVRGGNFRCERREHIARIGVAPRHLFAIASVNERDIVELLAKVFIGKRDFCFLQRFVIKTVASHLLQSILQRLREAALLCRAREGF